MQISQQTIHHQHVAASDTPLELKKGEVYRASIKEKLIYCFIHSYKQDLFTHSSVVSNSKRYKLPGWTTKTLLNDLLISLRNDYLLIDFEHNDKQFVEWYLRNYLCRVYRKNKTGTFRIPSGILFQDLLREMMVTSVKTSKNGIVRFY